MDDLNPNLRLATFWNCLDERQKNDLERIKGATVLKKQCCDFCQELLRASMASLEKDVSLRWRKALSKKSSTSRSNQPGVKIFVTPKGDFLPETSLGSFVDKDECQHCVTVEVAQGPTYTVEAGAGDNIMNGICKRVDGGGGAPQKRKGGGKKKGKNGKKKKGGGEVVVFSKGGGETPALRQVSRKVDAIMGHGGWSVGEKQCWYCRDKLYVRFTDLLTYPRPIRQFRMLLDKDITLGELEAIISDDVNRGYENGDDPPGGGGGGPSSTKFNSFEPVILMRKGKALEGKHLTMADLKIRSNQRLVISRPVGKRLEVDDTVQERNRQFVGDLLFGQDPSEEPTGNSIVESFRLNYGHQILGLLVCKSLGDRAIGSWNAEVSARVHQQDLLNDLFAEEAQASKKEKKKKKKKEQARRKKEEERRRKDELEARERAARDKAEAEQKRKERAEAEAVRRKQEEEERAKREEEERQWRLRKARQDAEEHMRRQKRVIEERRQRERRLQEEEARRRAQEAREKEAREARRQQEHREQEERRRREENERLAQQMNELRLEAERLRQAQAQQAKAMAMMQAQAANPSNNRLGDRPGGGQAPPTPPQQPQLHFPQQMGAIGVPMAGRVGGSAATMRAPQQQQAPMGGGGLPPQQWGRLPQPQAPTVGEGLASGNRPMAQPPSVGFFQQRAGSFDTRLAGSSWGQPGDGNGSSSAMKMQQGRSSWGMVGNSGARNPNESLGAQGSLWLGPGANGLGGVSSPAVGQSGGLGGLGSLPLQLEETLGDNLPSDMASSIFGNIDSFLSEK
jgi:hypothetical protein